MIIGKREFVIGKRTYIMGILNVTPDSFSDGGKFFDVKTAVKRTMKMVYQGADIIDVGGESTRPGHSIINEEEEIRRVIPIIKALRCETDIPISIDTSKSEVAKEALASGADMVNDIWGLKKDLKMAEVISQYKVPCCIMHNRDNNKYKNLIPDIIHDLEESIEIAIKAGISTENIIIDPGIGFAKTLESNIEIMSKIDCLKALNYPILLGASRKSMIGLTLDLPVEERLEGTLATTAIGIAKGCDFIRVHDIKENKRVALMTDAIFRK